ncbi:MAG: aminoglycoside phosphotransferase family protein [Candidatus Nanopelagicales bacterium]
MDQLVGEPGCDVVALVPRTSDSSLLFCTPAAPVASNRLVLPNLRLAFEPTIEDITQQLAELLGGPVTLLRANALAWRENFDAASIVVEVEPLSWTPAASLGWEPIDESRLEAVDPSWARASVASWLHERASGWSDRRPQWSRPGWMAEASRWLHGQMEAAGYREPQPAKIHHLWGLSVVLSADSLNGTAYLKCSGDHFRAEAAVTQALATRSPALVPDVIAVDSERGWLLMRDLRAHILGDQPEREWWRGLDALVTLQKQWIGRTDELLDLGVDNRPLVTLAAWADDSVRDLDLLSGLTAAERENWSSQVPAMVASCHNLADLGLKPSLVHGDFHPWNVVSGDRGAQIFDWTDAAVAHPFLDLVTYIMRSPDPDLRQAMLLRYLDAWESDLPRTDLHDVGHLALVVGALHQAHTFRRLIPTVMPDDLAQLRGGDAQWLRRAMRLSTGGIEAAY